MSLKIDKDELKGRKLALWVERGKHQWTHKFFHFFLVKEELYSAVQSRQVSILLHYTKTDQKSFSPLVADGMLTEQKRTEPLSFPPTFPPQTCKDLGRISFPATAETQSSPMWLPQKCCCTPVLCTSMPHPRPWSQRNLELTMSATTLDSSITGPLIHASSVLRGRGWVQSTGADE